MRNERQPLSFRKKAGLLGAGVAFAVAGCGGGVSVDGTPMPRPATQGEFTVKLGENQAIEVHAGDIISGDVEVGPTGTKPWLFLNNETNRDIIRLHDDFEKTGLIVRIQTDGTVFTKYHAVVEGNISQDKTVKYVADEIKAMKQNGCVDGCESVDVVDYTGPDTETQWKKELPAPIEQPKLEPKLYPPIDRSYDRHTNDWLCGRALFPFYDALNCK